MTKRKRKVATKRNSVREQEHREREYRLVRLARMVRFAYSAAGPAQLREEMKQLRLEMHESDWQTIFPGDPNQAHPLVESAQKALRRGLEILTSTPSERIWEDNYGAWILPEVNWVVTRPEDQPQGHFEARADVSFLYACADYLCGPEGWRVQRCLQPGCKNPFVKIKRARFCDEHRSAKSKSQRFILSLKETDPSELKKRRHKYYLTRLQKQRRAKTRSVKSEAVTK
jgi:hypothetical protein